MAMDRSSRPMHRGRKKVCSFCVDRVEHIDYKDLPRLRKYVSERAKIIPRRVTGTCAFHQACPLHGSDALRQRLISPRRHCLKCTEKEQFFVNCSFLFMLLAVQTGKAPQASQARPAPHVVGRLFARALPARKPPLSGEVVERSDDRRGSARLPLLLTVPLPA